MQKPKKEEIQQSDLITKGYLNERLKEERTYIDGKIDKVIQYIDFKIEPIKGLREEFTTFKSDIFDRLDWIIGTLKKMEEEMMVFSKQQEDLKQQVEMLKNESRRLN